MEHLSTVLLALLLPLALVQCAPQGYGYEPYSGGERYLPPAATTQAPLVRKQFYTISAPEEHAAHGQSKHLVIGRPSKNYRVVFIKAPAGDNSNVKLSASFAPQEEKTVIYVLSKKDNELDVNNIATPAPTQPSKPEIFFIKYKTPAEAAAVQREIQAKYDQLGGTNEYTDEGTAPITSVVGALDGQTPAGGYDYRQITGGTAGNPLTQYLPPVLN